MLLHYLCIHVLVTAICVAIVLVLESRLALGLFCTLLFGITAFGFGLERFPDWAWSGYGAWWPDLIYFSNLSLEAVAVLVTLLWLNVRNRAAGFRAILLTVVALGVAVRSYAWYFQPTPVSLVGTVDAKGFCWQTSRDSCSAASAAMLLHARGIPTTEAEMAQLCLTRDGMGTPTLGLFRGVAMKAKSRGFHPQMRAVPVGEWGQVAKLPLPAIISVGLRGWASPELRKELEGYGWSYGFRHALLLLAADPQGQWIDVADPSYGRERWPTRNLEYLWDGRALLLQPHP